MRLEIVNPTLIFKNLPAPPIIANDFDLGTTLGDAEFHRAVSIEHVGDYTDSAPSCPCRTLVGGREYGNICQVCNMPVLDDYNRPFESRVWVKAPDRTPGLVHPIIWHNLVKFFSEDTIRWLCDPSLPVPKNAAKLEAIHQAGIPRGYNYFVTHVRDFIRLYTGNTPDRRFESEQFIDFLDKYDDVFFQEYLPFPTPTMFVKEITARGTFAQHSRRDAIAALLELVNAERKFRNETELSRAKQISLERMTATGLTMLTEFYLYFWKDEMSAKPGILRLNVFGTLLHFTIRGVIASIPHSQHYLECHLPWSMAVQLYSLELTGVMLRGHKDWKPLTLAEIGIRIKHAYNHFDPLIASIFDKLIEESYMELKCPTNAIMGKNVTAMKALPLILQRNPSLMRASAQLLGVTKIKHDPQQNTIDTNHMILTGFNADFDGDALNGYKINDKSMYEKLRRMRPEFSVMDLNVPNSISSNLAIPAPVVATTAHWMHEEANLVKNYLKEHPEIVLN